MTTNPMWHWVHCPQCRGTGEVEVVTGASLGGTDGGRLFTERCRCNACNRSGLIAVPDGYHLEPNVAPLRAITTNRTTAVGS